MNNAQSIESLLTQIENDPALQQKHKERAQVLEEALAQYAKRQAGNAREIEQAGKGNVIRFAMVGDTHFGSLYERIDVLRACVKACEQEGIEDLFHAGDVLDGHKGYPGHEFELHKHGWEQQSSWFADQMPRTGKVRCKFITGNHDAKFKHAAGIEVGKALAELRPDWEFLGADIGNVVIKAKDGRPLRVSLIHPDGGSSYALSYRPQKIIEQWAGGSKPDVLGIGHYHKANMLPRYRNVCVIQVGSTQDQTPFMARKGLAAHVGFWIIEAVPSKRRGDLWSRYKAEFVSFYEEARSV